MKTRLLVAASTKVVTSVIAAFVAFASFAFQALPASADGLVVVTCPPIDISPNPGGTPIPLPFPNVGPTSVPGMPPIVTPRPPVVPPRPPNCPTYLAVKNHNVTVTIDNQIARTRVDQTFINDSTYQLEGTYIFPLPDDAAISEFAMWVDGKKLEGQVLDRNQARQIYEDIVRSRRDPALLEYVGRNAFRASIFPIPPRTEKRVEIEYAQVLKAEQGLVRYVYPLNTEKFSPKPLASVSVNVSVRSNAALKAIYSPSHDVSVSRDGDFRAKVGYEAANVKPDRDFVLYYSVTQDDIGLNLLSYKGSDDGFFLMLVAPKVEVSRSQVIAKDVILVLDISGSMQGQKIEQAKRALSYVLDQLNDADRFNIIAFSTGTTPYASSLRPASARNDARNFVSRLRAEGSTDINRALLEAMSNADKVEDPALSSGKRPTIVVFLTDGLPTTGETNSQKIIANVTNSAPKNIRLFTFGVGDDVNTIMLDTLAEKLRGASGYVRPNEKIDEIVSAFYAKVSIPVLSDLTVDWGGITVSDVYPYPLPDLFAGTQLVVAGRYRNGGPTTITLKGLVNGTPQTFRYSDVTFKNSGGEDSIPRLWATRKIGYLLNEIRLRGESKEIVNEIVTLAVRYGIVTPYTSFLVDERRDVLTDSGRGGAAQDLSKTFAAPAARPTSGAAAVQQSQEQNQLRGANVAPTMAPVATSAPRPGAPGPVEQVAPVQALGDKTFLLRNGVWTDTQFDPSKMTTKKIEFNSDAYFALAQNTGLGKYLALGARVIVVLNGVAYEITDDGSGASSPEAVPTALPSALPAAPPKSEISTPIPGASPQARTVEPDALNTTLLIGGGLLGAALAGGVGIVAVLVLRSRFAQR
ncbi:MAG: VWA domain-containing protein [Chloroflexi bacterium]|nr:VWA domain-containing protein [Chloroflexota bacterium]